MAIKRIKVEIIKTLYLPRFKVDAGFEWEVAAHRKGKEGFPLSGEYISNSKYIVIGLIRS